MWSNEPVIARRWTNECISDADLVSIVLISVSVREVETKKKNIETEMKIEMRESRNKGSRNQGSRNEQPKEKRANEGSSAISKGLSEHAKKSR
ncbi:hypothetical protein BA20089_04325 [Bifidobacterium asteroides DSM 20089]|uniref:Uncharacterized protein n=1 Tax=Bifidobacterium asteroides DSM 20089 TaxID=1437594 RepID=A0AAD0EWW3_9BIFI|nr:hypothetical protein [Bifidobacterium asteroides]ATO41451.1 hypothetical protein BA20089_04325 [Bifidobacterium asteroides DSM 20089]